MARKLHAHQIDIKYYYFKPIDFSNSQKQNNKMDYSAK